MSLRNRHFLKLLDFSPQELRALVQASSTLKNLRVSGQERPALSGRSLAMLFQENCPHTLWATCASASTQGAQHSLFVGSQTGLGPEESVTCNAPTLGRLFDALAVFGVAQERVEELARLAGKPVCNLSSHDFQPLQILADLTTMSEQCAKPLDELSVTFLGDGRSSVARSLMVGAAKLGIDLRFCGPKDLQPEENLTETCLALGAETGGQIRLFTEVPEAMKGADFVYSHSWAPADSTQLEDRAKLLLPYRATRETLSFSGSNRCLLLHRMPLILEEQTSAGQMIYEKFELEGLEVSRELFDSASCLAFEQAENLMHCCKAVLVSLLA